MAEIRKTDKKLRLAKKKRDREMEVYLRTHLAELQKEMKAAPL
jgi:hypothetical protein